MTVIAQLLPLAMQIIAQYREARDAAEAAQAGSSGMLSDRELFDLLEKDAKALIAHSDQLIAKWKTMG